MDRPTASVAPETVSKLGDASSPFLEKIEKQQNTAAIKAPQRVVEYRNQDRTDVFAVFNAHQG
jgi:hypothetical protein